MYFLIKQSDFNEMATIEIKSLLKNHLNEQIFSVSVLTVGTEADWWVIFCVHVEDQ